MRRQEERQQQRQQQQAAAAAQVLEAQAGLGLVAEESLRLARQERALARQIGDLLLASGTASLADLLARLPLEPPGPVCADVPGQTCTVVLVGEPGAGVAGTAVGTVLASQLWRAEVRGLPPGAAAVIVLQTTRGFEVIPCPSAVPGTTVCVGRTLGNALLNTPARVFVNNVLLASGPVLGPGPRVVPRQPPAPPTPTITPSPTETGVPSGSPTPTATSTATLTPTRTATSLATATATLPPTATATASPTPTATPGCAAPLLLGAQGAAALSSNLFVLNPATGAGVRTIGPIGFALTGLAQNPLSGQLFGSTTATSTQAPRSLVRLTSTGAGVVVGSYGLVNDSMADLAFDGAGILYGWSSLSGNLLRIDQATGAATPVGASGLGVPQGAGLTFAQGSLFLSMDRDTGSLRRINPATGTALAATPLVGGVGRPIGALAADPSGSLLLGARLDTSAVPRTADLIAIDPASGAIAVRGASINQLDALAFACFP